MDGSKIQGYPLQGPVEEQADNRLELDTTGEYFSPKRRMPARVDSESYQEAMKFFVDHAFFFLAHRAEILADSRMFLAPVNVPNNLAYSGTSGLRDATLGVYLEWWAECVNAVFEEDGHKWLVWFFAGSPLSGSNKCKAVNEKGESKPVQRFPFMSLWHTFMDINRRYDPVKGRYQAYTLEEVVSILSADDKDEDTLRLMVDNFFLRSHNKDLSQKLQTSEAQCKELRKELVETKIRHDIDWYREVYHNLQEANKAFAKRVEDLRAERMELRKRLKAGELTNVQYQRLLMPVNKELSHSCDPLPNYDQEVQKKDKYVTIDDVVNFFAEDAPGQTALR